MPLYINSLNNLPSKSQLIKDSQITKHGICYNFAGKYQVKLESRERVYALLKAVILSIVTLGLALISKSLYANIRGKKIVSVYVKVQASDPSLASRIQKSPDKQNRSVDNDTQRNNIENVTSTVVQKPPRHQDQREAPVHGQGEALNLPPKVTAPPIQENEVILPTLLSFEKEPSLKIFRDKLDAFWTDECNKELRRNSQALLYAISNGKELWETLPAEKLNDWDYLYTAWWIYLETSWHYADPALFNDKDFVLEALKIEDYTVAGVNTPWFKKPQANKFALGLCHDSIWKKVRELAKNRSFLLEALKITPFHVWTKMDNHLFSDVEFMIQAIQVDHGGIERADQSLYLNHRFMLEAFKARKNNALYHAKQSGIIEDPDFRAKLLEWDPTIFN